MFVTWPAVARVRALAGRNRPSTSTPVTLPPARARAPAAMPMSTGAGGLLESVLVRSRGEKWSRPEAYEHLNISNMLREQQQLAVRALQPELERHFATQLNAAGVELGKASSHSRRLIHQLLLNQMVASPEQKAVDAERNAFQRQVYHCPVRLQNSFLRALYPAPTRLELGTKLRSTPVLAPKSWAGPLLDAVSALPRPWALHMEPAHLCDLVKTSRVLVYSEQPNQRKQTAKATQLYIKVMSDIEEARMPISLRERAHWLYALAVQGPSASAEFHSRFMLWKPLFTGRSCRETDPDALAVLRNAGLRASFPSAVVLADSLLAEAKVLPSRVYLNSRLTDAETDVSLLAPRLAEFAAAKLPLGPSAVTIAARALLSNGHTGKANQLLHRVMQHSRGRFAAPTDFTASASHRSGQSIRVLDYLSQNFGTTSQQIPEWQYQLNFLPTAELAQLYARDRATRGNYDALQTLLTDCADRGVFLSPQSLHGCLYKLRPHVNIAKTAKLIMLLLDFNTDRQFWTARLSEAAAVLLTEPPELRKFRESFFLEQLKSELTAMARGYSDGTNTKSPPGQESRLSTVLESE